MNYKTTVKIIALVIMICAIILRISSLPHKNADTDVYIQWYNQLANQGFSKMADNYSVYTPPYLYLLWLATLTKGAIQPLLAIKLIPIIFDCLSAFAVYKLVKLKYPHGNLPFLSFAGFFLLPTVLVNSSFWGQVDSFYTSFLLLCIFFLVTNRPLPAMLVFGMAISIKIQSVFLVPFLIVMAFKKHIPWSYFFLVPFVYLLTILPAVLAGMPFIKALTIYVSQANASGAPSMNAPNLYSLIIYPPFYIDWEAAVRGGLFLAAISIISWTVIYTRRQYELNHKVMILSMLASLALVPYVLPKMHDRYFYPADVLSYIFAFYYPAYWFIPLLFQGASGIMYYVFLSSVDPGRFHILFPIAAAFSTIAVATLLVKQHRETSNALKE